MTICRSRCLQFWTCASLVCVQCTSLTCAQSSSLTCLLLHFGLHALQGRVERAWIHATIPNHIFQSSCSQVDGVTSWAHSPHHIEIATFLARAAQPACARHQPDVRCSFPNALGGQDSCSCGPFVTVVWSAQFVCGCLVAMVWAGTFAWLLFSNVLAKTSLFEQTFDVPVSSALLRF